MHVSFGKPAGDVRSIVSRAEYEPVQTCRRKREDGLAYYSAKLRMDIMTHQPGRLALGTCYENRVQGKGFILLKGPKNTHFDGS